MIIFAEKIVRLKKEFRFSRWKKIDENHTAVRFCTSWATRKEDVDRLIEVLT